MVLFNVQKHDYHRISRIKGINMTKFNKEQIFVVTGASSGIGEATANMLNKEGATVIGIGRNLERLRRLQEQSCNPDNMHIEQKELTENIKGLPEYIQYLKEKYGKLNGLACCSGITQIEPLRVLNIDNMKKVFDINYYVPIFLAKGFVKKDINIGKGASFVNVASIVCSYPMKGLITYSGSKSAIVTSLKAIALEYANKGIRFNNISPADVDTPMTQNLSEIMNSIKNNYPLGFAEPNDVATMILYLLTNDSKWITGQNYILDCCSR